MPEKTHAQSNRSAGLRRPVRGVVQRGRRTGPFTARTATDGERAALWPVLTRHNPAYRDHQTRTRRTIPVVVLTPARP